MKAANKAIAQGFNKKRVAATVIVPLCLVVSILAGALSVLPAFTDTTVNVTDKTAHTLTVRADGQTVYAGDGASGGVTPVALATGSLLSVSLEWSVTDARYLFRDNDQLVFNVLTLPESGWLKAPPDNVPLLIDGVAVGQGSFKWKGATLQYVAAFNARAGDALVQGGRASAGAQFKLNSAEGPIAITFEDRYTGSFIIEGNAEGVPEGVAADIQGLAAGQTGFVKADKYQNNKAADWEAFPAAEAGLAAFAGIAGGIAGASFEVRYAADDAPVYFREIAVQDGVPAYKRCNDNEQGSTTALAAGDNGRFTLAGLADESIYIKELTPLPPGYYQGGDTGAFNPRQNSANVAMYGIPTGAALRKFASDGNTPLNGSTFQIYVKNAEDAWGLMPGRFTNAIVKTASGEVPGYWYAAQEGNRDLVTGPRLSGSTAPVDQGFIYVFGLPEGDYKFLETKAPYGHEMSSPPMETAFSVSISQKPAGDLTAAVLGPGGLPVSLGRNEGLAAPRIKLTRVTVSAENIADAGTPLAGAGYKLLRSGGDMASVQEVFTGSAGTVAWEQSYLGENFPGHYTLVETTASPGAASLQPILFEIDAQGNVKNLQDGGAVVSFEKDSGEIRLKIKSIAGTETGMLQVTAAVTDAAGDPLPGDPSWFEFIIADGSGAPLNISKSAVFSSPAEGGFINDGADGKFKLRNNGFVTVGGLAEGGEYTVTQTPASDFITTVKVNTNTPSENTGGTVRAAAGDPQNLLFANRRPAQFYAVGAPGGPSRAPSPGFKIKGTKTVSGNGAPGETFDFTLTQVQNAQGDALQGPSVLNPNPRTLQVVTNGEGSYAFEFDIGIQLADGTYFFRVKEQRGSAEGWEYDPIEYTVRAVVTDGRVAVYYPDGAIEGEYTTGQSGTIDITPESNLHPAWNNPTGAARAPSGRGMYWGQQYGVGDEDVYLMYMRNNSGGVAVGALYCMDKTIGYFVSRYGPFMDFASIEAQFPYYKEMMWLVRNGFASTGYASSVIPAPERDHPAHDEGYEWIFAGTNNLAEVMTIPGMPAGLHADEAYVATQLAIWHFTNSINPGFPDVGPNTYFTTPSVERIGQAYQALLDAATYAALTGSVITQLSLSVTFDTAAANQTGDWYGPVKLRTSLLPPDFTSKSSVPINLSAVAPGLTISRTAGGPSYTGPYYDDGTNDTFYVNTAALNNSGIVDLVKATATIAPAANIKDTYFFTGSDSFGNWTAGQPTIGLGAIPRALDLAATANLYYGASGSGLNFKNTWKPPENPDVTIEGKKTVTGKLPPNHTFVFTLTQVKNAQGDELEGGISALIVRVDTNGEGDYSFSFDFELPRGDATYYYKVQEINGGEAGWIYDPIEYIVKVVVLHGKAVVYYPDGTVTGGYTTGEDQRVIIDPTDNVISDAGNTFTSASWRIWWGRDTCGIYSMTNSTGVVVSTMYCIDRNTGAGTGPGYLPVTTIAEFEARFPYHKELRWLARNGFMSTGTAISRTIDPVREAETPAYPYVHNFAGINNLEDVKRMPGMPAGLLADEAYCATQLAVWHFANGFNPVIGGSTSTDRIRDAYNALLAAVARAVAAGEVITELSLGVRFDTTAADLVGGWYGPVKLKVSLTPVDFTSKANIPINLSAVAPGITISKTPGGAPFSGPFYDNGTDDTFYINVGAIDDPGIVNLVEATASVAPNAPIKDVYIFRYHEEWPAGQPTMGIGAMPRTLDLTAKANLYFGASDSQLCFRNKYGRGVKIPGCKRVEAKGDSAPDKTFTFTLTQVENAAGDPLRGTPVITPNPMTVTAETTGQGQYDFSFTLDNLPDGTWYFRIAEVNDHVPEWIYDESSYIVTVVVRNGIGSVIGGDSVSYSFPATTAPYPIDPNTVYSNLAPMSENFFAVRPNPGQPGQHSMYIACAEYDVPAHMNYGGYYDFVVLNSGLDNTKAALANALHHPDYGSAVPDAIFFDMFGIVPGTRAADLRRRTIQAATWLFEIERKGQHPGIVLNNPATWPTGPDSITERIAETFAPYYGSTPIMDSLIKIINGINAMMARYPATPAGEGVTSLSMSVNPATGVLTVQHNGYVPPHPRLSLSWSGDTAGLTVTKNGAAMNSGDAFTLSDEIIVAYTGTGDVAFLLKDTLQYLAGGSVRGSFLQLDGRPAEQKFLSGYAKFVTLECEMSLGQGGGKIVFLNIHYPGGPILPSTGSLGARPLLVTGVTLLVSLSICQFGALIYNRRRRFLPEPAAI